MADPTGAGDAFRSGFLAAVAWGLSLERAAQLGNLLAVHALETVGTQEYELKPATLADRFTTAYGAAAAAEVASLPAGLISLRSLAAERPYCVRPAHLLSPHPEPAAARLQPAGPAASSYCARRRTRRRAEGRYGVVAKVKRSANQQIRPLGR